MLERKLVAASLWSRSAYDAVAASGEADSFDDVLQTVFRAIGTFYARDPDAARADPTLLAASLLSVSLNPKRGRECADTLASLAAEEVSVDNVREYLADQVRDRTAMALASALAAKRPEEEVKAALTAYQDALVGEEKGETDDAAPTWGDALRSRVDLANRLVVSPRSLNEHLRGGVCPGHNITIFGRPESGKTALALTMACGFARRKKKVLYIGNEDPIQDLMTRAITNLADASVDDLAQDPDRYERDAMLAGAGNLVMRSTAPGTLREVEALVRQHQPDVLFVDQLRNITSGKSDNYTQLLDRNAQAVRALGKKYNMVTVSVTQAGDSAEGRPVLGMGDVDSSNTGIPGAADVMIGVGVTEALDKSGQRVLSLCKNKLGTHSQVLVQFDPFRSKMK